MMNRKIFALVVFLFGLSLMAACSKNLMPPEGLETAAVDSQLSQSKDSRSSKGFNIGERGSGESGRFNTESEGFNVREQGSDGSSSGFLTEEDVGESARSGEFGGSSGNGSGIPGGGSSGRFHSEPFLGDSSKGSGGSNGFGGGGRGRDEARALPFKDTSSLQDIHFKFDKYDLDDQSRGILRQNADYLKTNSSAIIEIQGHCDERGTNNYNIALGERRAQSTKMYMVSQGISAKRIHTISYGEEKPFCFDSNNGCWFKNRRAHFRINK